MSKQVETALRGPQAYALARDVIAEMEKAGVWPTPLNFELWLHYVSDPDGALAREIRLLLKQSGVISDKTSEMLAAEFLPRGRLPDQIRDVGAVLDRELASVANAIAMAHKTQADYGETLADASQTMENADDAPRSGRWSGACPPPPAACGARRPCWKSGWRNQTRRSCACARTWSRSAATP